jgi:hypothetical protein
MLSDATRHLIEAVCKSKSTAYASTYALSDFVRAVVDLDAECRLLRAHCVTGQNLQEQEYPVTKPARHSLVVALLEQLPVLGTAWPVKDRARWLAALDSILNFVCPPVEFGENIELRVLGSTSREASPCQLGDVFLKQEHMLIPGGDPSRIIELKVTHIFTRPDREAQS